MTSNYPVGHDHFNLSRRERQVVDIIFSKGTLSAKEVMLQMNEPPTYSAVRSILRILVQKGLIQREKSGNRYRYEIHHSHDSIRNTVIRRLIDTFFDGSARMAVMSFIGNSLEEFSTDELEELLNLIQKAQKEGR